MKKRIGFIGLMLLPSMLVAVPFVPAYERFHANEPSAEGGALLYSELGCANCHGGSAVVTPRKGPSLENLSSRVDYHWVLDFLKDPETGRKGSTMPAMMHGMSGDEVKAVAAYLSTLGKGLQLKAERHANAELGSALYHEKGCVACHAPTADYHGPAGTGLDLVSPHAVALPDLKRKTSLVALEHFLLNTSKYRPDGRMPHVELGRDGAINVAAHLLDIQGSDPREAKGVAPWPKAGKDQVMRGRAIVEKAGCASCHDLPGIKAPGSVPLSKTVGRDHCYSPNPRSGLARYSLSEGQRKSLEEYFLKPGPKKDADGSLTLKAMNCYACHDRDGLGGPSPITDHFFHGNESLGDSGRLPPPLTGIGHKLRKDWLAGVLAGGSEKRVRPYVLTVMPSYPEQAKALADCLAEVDARAEAKPLVDAAGTQEDGRTLLGTQGGVNCITCHHWGEQQSLGIPGLDISSLNQRLRPEWFRSYLLDPAGYRPGTLMPALWPHGKSSIPGVLEGDSEKQIAAIWEFIERGEVTPPGFPDRGGRQFELKPTTRPIVQRAFLTGAGTKAILVGFPGDIHLAYDGDAARPALLWRGAFFDAYSTWFMRMAPFEKPMSDDVYSFPKMEGERRFRGYQLDEEGVPTFQFVESGRVVRERFEVARGEMRRVLTWEKGSAPKINHPEGVEAKVEQEEKKLTVIYRWK
ncbi:c-type cytochrome [Akkermansiaceae bacterium]|nr:c-type cytochrome [Akkermansiaceae bacterium]